MTRNRDLGPILAMAGGAIAVAAVIAGFLVTGGPGDTRERRLDDMTMQRISTVAQTAECAFLSLGKAPATIEEASAAFVRDSAPSRCGYGALEGMGASKISNGGQPEAPGGITYARTDDSHIHVCGNFRRPQDAGTEGPDAYLRQTSPWPELQAPRPEAGVHCYDITLMAQQDIPPVEMSIPVAPDPAPPSGDPK